MDATSPTRLPLTANPPEGDPIRWVYLAALDSNDELARLIILYLAVLSDE